MANENCSNKATTLNAANADQSKATTLNAAHADQSKATTLNAANADQSKATTLNAAHVGQSKATALNAAHADQSKATTLNEQLTNQQFESAAKETKPNNASAGRGGETTPNLGRVEVAAPAPVQAEGIAEGTVIDGYTVGEALSNKGGEALLYKCTNSKGEAFALKYYLRELSDEETVQHQELLSELKAIRKGVVKILSSDFYNGHLYEIMPFYSAGSLRDRLNRLKKDKGAPPYFTEEEIRKDIFPQMLKILKSIHDRAIYHADIKPENIMYKSARSKELVLIDFGVSKKKHTNDTFTRLQGGTECYLAPEAKMEGIWEGTDYYALGVILYELIVGEIPQHISGTSSISGLIPRIDKSIVSDDLDRLLVYLNFGATMFRKTRDNHYNRWLYDEASKWPNEGWPSLRECPNEGWPSLRGKQIVSVNVRFNNKNCGTMDELLFALAGDWDRGRDFVARPEGGLVSGLAKSASRDRSLLALSSEVAKFVELATKSGQSEDVILFEFIYQYGNGIEPVLWKGGAYSSLNELGQAVLRSLASDSSEQNPFCELFTERLLEVYMNHRSDLPTSEQNKIMRVCDIDFSDDISYKMYKAAYALIDDKYYYLQNGECIKTPAGLKAYLAREGSKENLLGFMALCREFVDDAGMEKAGFKAWLDANAGAHGQAADAQKEIESLPSIPADAPNLQFNSKVAEKSKQKGSFWGIPLGMIFLAITIAPFSLFVMALNNGTIADADVTMKYIYLTAAIGLPIIPLLIARLLCIPRNRVTNTCFRFVSVICRILKYDVLATGAALVFDQYSSISAVNVVARTLRSGYAWVLQALRDVIGNLGTDDLLNYLALKMKISHPWFNDVVRLVAVFIIYTIVIAIFRRRKAKR